MPVVPPDLLADTSVLDRNLDAHQDGNHTLLAFPAQSNFSGVHHPLEWIGRARTLGWDVLLDAAAFVPTNPLDLGRYQPDFVAVSFYKIFGYPTGIGTLIAQRAALEKLHRPWFSGGTISVASVQGAIAISCRAVPRHSKTVRSTISGYPPSSTGSTSSNQSGCRLFTSGYIA